MGAGVLPSLIAMLSSFQQSVQRAALGALKNLLGLQHSQTCDALMSAGPIMQSLGKICQCQLAWLNDLSSNAACIGVRLILLLPGSSDVEEC